MHTLLFIGPQGSGKGTQVSMLEESWKASGRAITRIQTGDIFRALSTTDSFAAQTINECITAGRLMPNAITDGLVVERILREIDAQNTLIFDGYPRNQVQVATLMEVLQFFGRKKIDVIHLDTPDAEVRERMEERGRSDDTSESIAARLATYHQETEPLLEHFRSMDAVRVHDIDGADTMEAVHDSIMNVLS